MSPFPLALREQMRGQEVQHEPKGSSMAWLVTRVFGEYYDSKQSPED
jgi:hypothetical protein